MADRSIWPRYPAYKDSGERWLGRVPSHWTVDRLKWTVQGCFNGLWGDEADGVDDLVVVRVADFDRDRRSVRLDNPTRRAIPKSARSNRLLRRGDLLIEKSGGGENQPVGTVVLYDHDQPAICSNFVARMPVRPGFSPRFLMYLHQAIYAHRLNARSIKQTTGIQNLDSAEYLNERAAFPPLDEQIQIEAYLDAEAAEIDLLIVKQERLMDLLTEKRQSVITRSVTEGLDRTVAMVDVDLTFLRKAPAHWKSGMLTKFIGPVVDYRGRTPTKADTGMFLVTARNIKGGTIDYEASQEFVDPKEATELLKRGKPQIGDVLFTMEAPLGEVAQIDREDIALAQRIVKFRGKEGILRNSFLKYWLQNSYCQAQLSTLATGSTALGIKASKLGQIECLIPPSDEQDDIVDHIRTETAKIDALIAKCRRAIELLREHRASLISAVVTGKIRVAKDVRAAEELLVA